MPQKLVFPPRILLAGLGIALWGIGCGYTELAPASAPSNPGGGTVEGVYTATLSEAAIFGTIILDLEQRGERVDGTYILRASGEQVRQPLTGTYDGTTLELYVPGAPDATEFRGTVTDGGRRIRGRLSMGFRGRFDVTFQRE